jgi:hypothetical protein
MGRGGRRHEEETQKSERANTKEKAKGKERNDKIAGRE